MLLYVGLLPSPSSISPYRHPHPPKNSSDLCDSHDPTWPGRCPPVRGYDTVFSINPSLHRPLVPSGLIPRITWLFVGFSTPSTFFRFSFCFSSLVSVCFSSFRLLSFYLIITKKNPVVGVRTPHSHYWIFLGNNQSALSSFFLLSLVYQFLVSMRQVSASFRVQSPYSTFLLNGFRLLAPISKINSGQLPRRRQFLRRHTSERCDSSRFGR